MIEINFNDKSVTWIGDASKPGAIRSFDVTVRANPNVVEQVLTSPFTTKLTPEEELHVLRAMVIEMAALMVIHAARIEDLEGIEE